MSLSSSSVTGILKLNSQHLLSPRKDTMTSLVRHHRRWCLLFTGALLTLAFTLHDAPAQFPPRPSFQAGGGFAGRPGGITGTPGGGFAGRPGGNFAGMPAGSRACPVAPSRADRAASPACPAASSADPVASPACPGPASSAIQPARFRASPTRGLVACRTCRAFRTGGRHRLRLHVQQVQAPGRRQDVFRCPHCGVQFSGTTFNGGSNPGFNPGFNPGQTRPVAPLRPDATVTLPPNAWKPVTPAPNPPTTPEPASRSATPAPRRVRRTPSPLTRSPA